MNTPLFIVVSEHSMLMVKQFRGKKFGWLCKWPIMPEWPMNTIEVNFHSFFDIGLQVP
jgi:hypothetical protein